MNTIAEAVIPSAPGAGSGDAGTGTDSGTEAGAGTDQGTVPDTGAPIAPNSVRLQSDSGDYVGGGKHYEYSRANSLLTLQAKGGHLSVRVTGDESWFADFALPAAMTKVQPGTYANLLRYPFHNPVTGGLSWSGDGRGCNKLTGSFTVSSVSYVGDVLKAVELSFEQHCEGRAPALHGQIHWNADDLSVALGPVDPPPASLWAPAAGQTPATGNYVYISSDPGDYIGGGKTSVYTPDTSLVGVSESGGRLSVQADGWSGTFVTMNSVTQLQPGYYGGLNRYPFNNPATGGLNWSGMGRGCNTLRGWFVVDAVTYVGTTLKSIDLRFEQHCEGLTPALHGKVHWVF
ncbi:hypothetical protein AB4Z46_21755 [Variovorax sp. M-6]|uniref:hypothetical protein n=1 Tax=Variovorax sp. M-6 TaxID=3233041 RepID=UPI003F98D6A1